MIGQFSMVWIIIFFFSLHMSSLLYIIFCSIICNINIFFITLILLIILTNIEPLLYFNLNDYLRLFRMVGKSIEVYQQMSNKRGRFWQKVRQKKSIAKETSQ